MILVIVFQSLSTYYSAKRRKGMILVLNEFERKLSEFYGFKMMVSTLAMDVWLCTNNREADNVLLCLEPA